MECFIEEPRAGAVYNLGGGRDNSCSILEAFELARAVSGRKMNYKYLDQNREGDHICYISDLSKIREDYPNWSITVSIEEIVEQIFVSWTKRALQNGR
jgi:CDP-paratose 2-epimerase